MNQTQLTFKKYTEDNVHIPVLLQETIQSLAIGKGDVIIDGTLGAGGHSEAILSLNIPKLTLLGIDEDEEAIERSEKRLRSFIENHNQSTDAQLLFAHSNSVHLDEVVDGLLAQKLLPSQPTKVLFDLGLSSYQLDESGRGFSFLRDEPLQMTFAQDATQKVITAYDVVNVFEEESIADILFGFGDERYSRRIAKAITQKRTESSIETTFELVDIIKGAVPAQYRHGKTHPATKTFQAIRIAVNAELQNLPVMLESAYKRLAPGGRIAVISFHSSEDRIVKHFCKEKVEQDGAQLYTKKPITPSQEEVTYNPRSRSAKLRTLILPE